MIHQLLFWTETFQIEEEETTLSWCSSGVCSLSVLTWMCAYMFP